MLLAEWSNALVLKTSVPQGTVGSNPSFSARKGLDFIKTFFYALKSTILGISPKSWGVRNSLLCEKNIFHGDFKGFI